MPKEQFFDIGVNLTHPSFVKDLDKVIEEAVEVGVNRMCVTGSDLEESISAYQLAFSLSDILIKVFNSALDLSQLILFFKRCISCLRILIFSAISKGIIINIKEKENLQYPFLLAYQLCQILTFYLGVALA